MGFLVKPEFCVKEEFVFKKMADGRSAYYIETLGRSFDGQAQQI